MRAFKAGTTIATVVVVSVFVTLLCLEAAMRVANGISISTFPNFMARELDIARASNGFIAFDDLLGWGLKENFSGVIVHDDLCGLRIEENVGQAGSSFSVGADGLRMNENGLRDPPENAILAVGDSFAAGSGVADKDAWPAQLERLIGKPVLNAGAGAYGVDQMVLRAERLAPVIKPRAFIVGMLSEDVLRDVYALFGGGYKPWFSVENGEAILRGTPVPRVSAHSMQMDGLRRILGRSYLVQLTMMPLGHQQWWLSSQLRYHRAQSDADAAESVYALMDRLVKLGTSYDAKVVVVIFHGAAQVMLPQPICYAARACDCTRARGLGVLDLYGPLREIGKSDRDRFKTLWINEGGVLGHPSAAGNEITARLLHDRFFR